MVAPRLNTSAGGGPKIRRNSILCTSASASASHRCASAISAMTAGGAFMCTSIRARRRPYKSKMALAITVALFVWLYLGPLQETGQLQLMGGLSADTGSNFGGLEQKKEQKQEQQPSAPSEPVERSSSTTTTTTTTTSKNRTSATAKLKPKPKPKPTIHKNQRVKERESTKRNSDKMTVAANSVNNNPVNPVNALFFPGPPKKFLPQPFDPDGLPNVVYGCGVGTDTGTGTRTSAEAVNGTTLKTQVDQIQIQIHVLLEDSPTYYFDPSKSGLWKQLQDADYSYAGWKNLEIPLYIHLANNTDTPMSTSTSLDAWKWKHGPKHILRVPTSALASASASADTFSWLDSLGNAAHQAGDNSLLVTLHVRPSESQIHLSPLYFRYLQQLIYQYARHPRCRDSNLMGFSLTSLVDSPTNSLLGQGREQHSAYLSVLPSTEATAFWSDQYLLFYQFAKRRLSIASNGSTSGEIWDIPGIKTTSTTDGTSSYRNKNIWNQLWTEFAFGRGAVMMYPNLQDQRLACASECPPSSQKTILSQSRWPNNASFMLPPYGDLAVLDTNLKLTTKEVVLATGTDYLNTISEHCRDCQDLLNDWARPGWTVPSIWKENSPLLCIADAYSSADLMHHRQQPPVPHYQKDNETRYLLFEPQFGTNNQIHAVMEGYYWAKLLGRQLVIPPILTPRVSHFFDKGIINRSHWVNFRKFYRLLPFEDPKNLFGDAMKAFPGHDLSPISFEEFEVLNIRPWRFLRLTRHTPFDPSARLLSDSLGMPAGDTELVNLRHLFNGVVPIDRVQHLLGGCHDKVLAFDNMYFAALKEAEPRQRMKDTLELSELVQDHIHNIQQVLHHELGSTNYSCYHVRQGDFAHMCDTIDNPANSSIEVSSWLAMTAKEFQCFVGNEDLKLELLDDPRPALILSDNPDALQDAIHASSTPTVTSQFIYNVTKSTSQMTGRDLDILSLIVDQSLCAASDVAILNKFSTVSQRVAKMRDEQGVRYWKKRNLGQ